MIKSRLRTAALMLMAATAALSFTACGGDEEEKPTPETPDGPSEPDGPTAYSPTSIKVEQKDYVIQVGKTEDVYVLVLPKEADQSITYASTDENVFKVESEATLPQISNYRTSLLIKGVGVGEAKLLIYSKADKSIMTGVNIEVTETPEQRKERALTYLSQMFTSTNIIVPTALENISSHIKGIYFKMTPKTATEGTLEVDYMYTKDYLKSCFKLSDSQADASAYYTTHDPFPYKIEMDKTNPMTGYIYVYSSNGKAKMFKLGYLVSETDMLLTMISVPAYTPSTGFIYNMSTTTTKPKVLGVSPCPVGMSWELCGQWKFDYTNSSEGIQESLTHYFPVDMSGTIYGAFNCYSYNSTGASKKGLQAGRFYQGSSYNFRIEKEIQRNIEAKSIGTPYGYNFYNMSPRSSCTRVITNNGTSGASEDLDFISSLKAIYNTSGKAIYEP